MRAFLLLILTIVSLSSSAFADRIVAIVEDTLITMQELQSRKRMLAYFNQVRNLSPEQDKNYTTMILQSMIDDQVLLTYAKNVNISATEKEISTFIRNVEANAKIPNGHLEKQAMPGINVSVEDFRKKMKVEVIRSKVIRDALSRNVNISQQDIESMVLGTNFRDAKLDLKIVTAKNNDVSSYKLMDKLSKKIKTCKSFDYIRYQGFAELSHVDTKLSELSPLMQSLVKDLPIDQASDVIEGDELRIVVVCDKSIDKFSADENNSIANFLGNKKLHIKAQKFFQDLRKKAYVKVML